MFKILIVEDNKTIAEELKIFLEKWGYQVEYVQDFQAIKKESESFSPHLILLDINLPFQNGFFWCEKIRQDSSVPIIFISSATDNMNQIMALNMGGDDFIQKPLNMDILVAKIQALLRRSYKFQTNLLDLKHKDVSLNLNDASFCYQGQTIELSKNEFKILQILMKNIGKLVSREDIMESLWDSYSFVDDNTLTVNINRLRKRLEEIGLYDYIKTKRGMGYFIDE